MSWEQPVNRCLLRTQPLRQPISPASDVTDSPWSSDWPLWGEVDARAVDANRHIANLWTLCLEPGVATEADSRPNSHQPYRLPSSRAGVNTARLQCAVKLAPTGSLA